MCSCSHKALSSAWRKLYLHLFKFLRRRRKASTFKNPFIIYDQFLKWTVIVISALQQEGWRCCSPFFLFIPLAVKKKGGVDVGRDSPMGIEKKNPTSLLASNNKSCKCFLQKSGFQALRWILSWFSDMKVWISHKTLIILHSRLATRFIPGLSIVDTAQSFEKDKFNILANILRMASEICFSYVSPAAGHFHNIFLLNTQTHTHTNPVVLSMLWIGTYHSWGCHGAKWWQTKLQGIINYNKHQLDLEFPLLKWWVHKMRTCVRRLSGRESWRLSNPPPL